MEWRVLISNLVFCVSVLGDEVSTFLEDSYMGEGFLII